MPPEPTAYRAAHLALGESAKPRQSVVQFLARRREILQQLHFAIEVNDERAILVRAEHLAEEAIAGGALFGQEAALADAGIDQEAERQGQAGFLGEIADGLRAAVFFEGEIVLGEVGDHVALSVANRGEEIDDADVGGEVWRVLAEAQRITLHVNK